MFDALRETPELGPDTLTARPYQEEAIEAAATAMKRGATSALIVHATGLGKTVIAGKLARRAHLKGKRTLILAHRDELITQMVNTVERVGIIPGIEKGPAYARKYFNPMVVAGSVQTMRGPRLASWPPDYFDLIIPDECFPAGTLIDGRPIESIRHEETVSSFNHETGQVEQRKVIRLFRRRTASLVRVHFDNGSSMVCTPDHPIFTSSENLIPSYVAARELRPHNMVYGTTPRQESITDGHEADVDGCGRGRRGIALRDGTPIARPEEGGLSPVARVDRVEVLEPGSDGRFGGLCPDGLVYNLEVEGNHNYFVNGLLVHNCHHGTSISYQNIFGHFPKARLVGITATPDRLDGDSLVPIFGKPVHEMDIIQAMTAPSPGPYLCRLRIEQRDCGIDLRDLRRKKNGDFSDGDLEERIKPHVETLANAIRQEAGERQTIVFTPGVESAQAIASALRTSAGLNADAIWDSDPDRKMKVARYREGESQFLVNFNILTEGFDAPATSCIAVARPTNSRALMSQMVGRGTRLGKPECVIVDFGFLTGQHGLVRPFDLFDIGDWTPAVRREVEATAAGSDILEAVEKAKAKVKAEDDRRREIEVKARKRDVSYKFALSYDPISGHPKAPPTKSLTVATHRPPTPKMVSFLRWHGHPDAASYSIGYAGKLIGIIKGGQVNERRA